MNIQRIIKEEIDKYINESVFNEDKKKEGSLKYLSQKEKAQKRDGNNISASDEKEIRYDTNRDDLLNIAALARKVYPDHTPEGAQSQLRKKLKGLKNDNGSQYHIKQREASAIRRELKNV